MDAFCVGNMSLFCTIYKKTNKKLISKADLERIVMWSSSFP